jgi:predicted chitinase
MEITSADVRRIMPNLSISSLELYLPPLQAAMQEFDINTELRAAAFLAQLAHESAELRYMQEIASGSAYEGRKDLGNIQPGDGKRYKGRGPIQLTGRANYRKYGELLGIDLETNPFQAIDPIIAFRIAGCFWKTNGLNEFADNSNMVAITKRINGGMTGFNSRMNYYNRAKKVLGI